MKRITNSELQTFKQCRRKWWLGWYRGYRPKAMEVTGVRSIGTRVHLSLAAYYTDGEDPILTYKAAAEHDKELCSVSRLDDLQKELDLGLAMIEGYMEWLSETGVDQGLTIVGVEKMVEVPSDIPGVTLMGKLDAVLERDLDGARLFMDHKTVGNFPEATKMLALDEQMLHYMLLLELYSKYEYMGSKPPLASALNIPGAQPATPVDLRGMQGAHNADNGPQGSAAGSPPQGRGLHEQRSEESPSDASGLPQQLPQQGETTSEKSSAQGGSEQSDEGQTWSRVDPGRESKSQREHERGMDRPQVVDGGLYNMLRKVKRSARAKPPFYERVEVRHNINELRSYWIRVHGEIQEIIRLEQALANGVDPRYAAYPSPTRDCTWKCDFVSVCPMFDDGSNAEGMLEALYQIRDPHDRYDPNAEAE